MECNRQWRFRVASSNCCIFNEFTNAISTLITYLILILFIVDRRRRKTLETQINRRSRYDLTRTSLQKIAKLLKLRLGTFHSQRRSIDEIIKKEDDPKTKTMYEVLCSEDFDEKRIRKKTIHTILDMICKQFSRDTFGKIIYGSNQTTEDEEWPHDFFKATYYERIIGSNGREYLERIAHVYPIGMTPREESRQRQLTPENAGVAYFVVQNGETRIIENVKDKKEREAKGWVNYYDRQYERYSSVLVMPVVHDLGVAGTRTVGVLTIDTGRVRYFRDVPEFKAFLSDILAPYLNFLALAWEIERLHESFSNYSLATSPLNQ